MGAPHRLKEDVSSRQSQALRIIRKQGSEARLGPQRLGTGSLKRLERCGKGLLDRRSSASLGILDGRHVPLLAPVPKSTSGTHSQRPRDPRAFGLHPLREVQHLLLVGLEAGPQEAEVHLLLLEPGSTLDPRP